MFTSPQGNEIIIQILDTNTTQKMKNKTYLSLNSKDP